MVGVCPDFGSTMYSIHPHTVKINHLLLKNAFHAPIPDNQYYPMIMPAPRVWLRLRCLGKSFPLSD